jgi:glucose-1-phosphate adenylyltransferase
MSSSIVMIMAGGKGSRLAPMTCHRAKPAVPVGGRYRIIDFVLSNFVNSGYRRIFVLTQYMASSLIRHLSRTWHMTGPGGSFVEVVPAQMRHGESWYRGTADSVFQNTNLIADHRPKHVAVFGGDHIYMMDIAQMEEHHARVGADLTIAAYPVPLEEATRFGVIEVDDAGRITGFAEKPANPKPMPGRPGWALVSMGNYFFRADVLIDEMDRLRGTDQHDFGSNVIPSMLARGRSLHVYDFATNDVGDSPETAPYWRDVGTIESYFEVNMDMRVRMPPIDMYNRAWPIRSAQRNFPPARFVSFAGTHANVRDSLVCEGAIVTAAEIVDVVLGYDTIVHRGALIENSVLLNGCNVGAGCALRRVLLDKNCSVEPGTVIGEDPEADRERFPFVSDSGIVVLPKGTHVPRTGPIQLAGDMVEAIANDPALSHLLEERQDCWVTSERNRHSFESVGPRFRRFMDPPSTPPGARGT